MKKVKVPCDFDGRPGSFQVLVGRPAPGFEPFHFQAAWLKEERGGRFAEDLEKEFQSGAQASGRDEWPAR